MTNRERAIEEVTQILIYLDDKIEAQSARILEFIDQLNQARERIAEMEQRDSIMGGAAERYLKRISDLEAAILQESL